MAFPALILSGCHMKLYSQCKKNRYVRRWREAKSWTLQCLQLIRRWRSHAGLGGAGLLSALFPFLSSHLSSVLALTTLIGLCCGVAFTSSYQLVSHFGVECSKSLTIGRIFFPLTKIKVCTANPLSNFSAGHVLMIVSESKRYEE